MWNKLIDITKPASDDEILRTDMELRRLAEEQGCDFRVATSKELFVDIDNDAQMEIFLKVLPVITKEIGVDSHTFHESKSGHPHYHMVVNLTNPQSEMTRIALQAALGSDPKREAISIARSMRVEPNVVVFFEAKR